MTAAGCSGRMRTPARSGSVTAYCPQRRNSGHAVQSCAIFSGTHMCGTIVKPILTKCEGWCVNAHSVAKPRAAAPAASSVTSRGPICRPRGVLIDDERPDFGDRLAERRQLGAADDRAVVLRDDETRRVLDDVVERAREQVPDLEVVRNQLVHRGARRPRRPAGMSTHGH